jgi:hypothetical protein
MIRRIKRVTIRDEEFISSEGIDFERISAYGGMERVPEPTRLETPEGRYEVRSYWTQEKAYDCGGACTLKCEHESCRRRP